MSTTGPTWFVEIYTKGSGSEPLLVAEFDTHAEAKILVGGFHVQMSSPAVPTMSFYSMHDSLTTVILQEVVAVTCYRNDPVDGVSEDE